MLSLLFKFFLIYLLISVLFFLFRAIRFGFKIYRPIKQQMKAQKETGKKADNTEGAIEAEYRVIDK